MSCYAAVVPSNKVQSVLPVYLELCGIQDGVPGDELHTTLLYDEDPSHDLFEPERDRVYHASVTRVGVLGDALVLFLETQDLLTRFDEVLSMGYTHSFPSLLPHITIKYNPSEEDIRVAKSREDGFKEVCDGLFLTGEYTERLQG